MAIRTVVTAGFGNGTFNGTITDVVLRGYTIGEAVLILTILANLAAVGFEDLFTDSVFIDQFTEG